jgi:hypothetical protein
MALEMSRYSAKSWKYWADETRYIRDNVEGEEPRRILAEIAAKFDRLHDWTLKQSGPSKQQQAIDVLMSRPFSPVKLTKGKAP